MKKNLSISGLVFAIVIGSVALTVVEWNLKSSPPAAPPAVQKSAVAQKPINPEPSKPDPAAEAAWEKIQPNLDAADVAAQKMIRKYCDRVDDFFAERKKRARGFAEDALSYRSKWAFAKSKLPFTDGEGHNKYLHELFETKIFTAKELEEFLQSVVKGCVIELQGIEGDLLVKIRADIGDDALGVMKDDVRFSAEAALRKKYAGAVADAAMTLKKDLPVWGGREAAAWVGADLTAPIIHSLAVSLIGRLGLSGGILGSGAASGAITLGGALVAGLIIDAAARPRAQGGSAMTRRPTSRNRSSTRWITVRSWCFMGGISRKSVRSFGAIREC